jgi:hypothetical protein
MKDVDDTTRDQASKGPLAAFVWHYSLLLIQMQLFCVLEGKIKTHQGENINT